MSQSKVSSLWISGSVALIALLGVATQATPGAPTLEPVPGIDLDTDPTNDYEAELVPGGYVDSRPLDPTPDDRLVVWG